MGGRVLKDLKEHKGHKDPKIYMDYRAFSNPG
jgi:hypothetical protein